MGQTVIVDSDNVVRVIDAGPPGPPGFGVQRGGDTGPIEMLGVSQSRSLPWTSWTQFNGIPLYALSFGPHKFTTAFASVPASLMSYSDQGLAPLHINLDPENKRIAMTAFLVNLTGAAVEAPEGARIVVTGAILTPEDGSEVEEVVLLDAPVYVLPPDTVGPPSLEDFDAIIASSTYESELALSEGTLLLTLEARIVDEEGAGFTDNRWTLGILRTSIWQGPENIIPRIDVSSPYTFQGMTAPQVNAVKIAMGGSSVATFISPQGMFFGHLKVDPDTGQFVGDGSASFETVVEPGEDPEDASLVTLRATGLRVLRTPSNPNDVVRLIDIDGGLPELQPMNSAYQVDTSTQLDGASYSIAYVDMNEDITLSFKNNALNTLMQLIVLGGSEARTLTLHGYGGLNSETVINPGEVYHFTVLASHVDTPEDPDIADISFDNRKLVEAPAPAEPLGQTPYQHAQYLVTDDVLRLDSVTQTIVANDQIVHVPNPGSGRWCLTKLNVANYSGSTKTLNLDCDSNHFSPSSGVPDGTEQHMWLIIIGGADGPFVDAVSY